VLFHEERISEAEVRGVADGQKYQSGMNMKSLKNKTSLWRVQRGEIQPRTPLAQLNRFSRELVGKKKNRRGEEKFETSPTRSGSVVPSTRSSIET